MSPDQARELFSEAFEGELEGERKAAFEQALAKDEELKQEYEDFLDTFRLVARIGEEDAHPAPDLLHGVQERLRKRSRGRYYRDRFAQRAGMGWLMPLVLGVICLFVLGAAYYALYSQVVVEQPPAQSDH